MAIGKPNEHLPQLGAARLYATDETWQALVGDLIQRSRLVVLRVGETEGFWWEVATISLLPDPTKLVFLLPTTTTQYERFRARAESHLPCILPSDYSPRPVKDRSFGGILWFEADWTPHLASCEPKVQMNRHAIANDLVRILSPVLPALSRPDLVPAGVARRLAAAVLDFLLFGVIVWGYGYTVTRLFPDANSGGVSVLLGAFVVPALFFYWHFGASEAAPTHGTMGKKIMGLVTLDKDGASLGLYPALLRPVVKMLTGFLPLLCWSVWRMHRGQRPLHDVLSGAAVYYLPPPAGPAGVLIERKRRIIGTLAVVVFVTGLTWACLLPKSDSAVEKTPALIPSSAVELAASSDFHLAKESPGGIKYYVKEISSGQANSLSGDKTGQDYVRLSNGILVNGPKPRIVAVVIGDRVFGNRRESWTQPEIGEITKGLADLSAGWLRFHPEHLIGPKMKTERLPRAIDFGEPATAR